VAANHPKRNRGRILRCPLIQDDGGPNPAVFPAVEYQVGLTTPPPFLHRTRGRFSSSQKKKRAVFSFLIWPTPCPTFPTFVSDKYKKQIPAARPFYVPTVIMGVDWSVVEVEEGPLGRKPAF